MKMIIAFITAVMMMVFVSPAFSQGGIEPTWPTRTGNVNVHHLYNQYQMMIEEVALSVSKGALGTLPQDADRWKSYLSAMSTYVDFWQSKAILDWPVTHGTDYELDNPLGVSCPFKSNLAACDLGYMLVNARNELVLSASAKTIPMHLYPADLDRQKTYWSAATDYIETYMLQVQPLDEPITSAEAGLGVEPGFQDDTP